MGKSIASRIACLRQCRESRELSRSLRESLLMDVTDDQKSGWVFRGESARVTSSTVVEYMADGGDVRTVLWTITIGPGRNCWSCSRIEVRFKGGVVPLVGILQRLLLANAVKLFVLRTANRMADQTLGN